MGKLLEIMEHFWEVMRNTGGLWGIMGHFWEIMRGFWGILENGGKRLGNYSKSWEIAGNSEISLGELWEIVDSGENYPGTQIVNTIRFLDQKYTS